MNYFKKYNSFINESIKDDLNKALKDKKDFISAYKTILIAHKKAVQENLMDDNLKNNFKEEFLNIVKQYNINDLQKFDSFVANLVKDRNFISLKKDFSKENEIYKKYFTDSKNIEPQKPQEVKASVVDNSPLPNIVSDNNTNTNTEVKNEIKISDNAKKLIESIKSDSKHQVPYVSIDVKNPKIVEYVKLIQEILQIKPDGSFGNISKEAVINFQNKNKLTPDGLVGQETWKALLGVVGVTGININVVKEKDKSVSTDTKQSISLVNAKVNQSFNANDLFENKVLEKIDNFNGVQFVIVKPFDSKNNTIGVAFKKDGKPLYYVSKKFAQGSDTLMLNVDTKTGKLNKDTKVALLNNLSTEKPKNVSSEQNDGGISNLKNPIIPFPEELKTDNIYSTKNN